MRVFLQDKNLCDPDALNAEAEKRKRHSLKIPFFSVSFSSLIHILIHAVWLSLSPLHSTFFCIVYLLIVKSSRNFLVFFSLILWVIQHSLLTFLNYNLGCDLFTGFFCRIFSLCPLLICALSLCSQHLFFSKNSFSLDNFIHSQGFICHVSVDSSKNLQFQLKPLSRLQEPLYNMNVPKCTSNSKSAQQNSPYSCTFCISFQFIASQLQTHSSLTFL